MLMPLSEHDAEWRMRSFGEQTAIISYQAQTDTPQAAAPYSQAIKAAGQIWVSGQLPADNTGKLIEGTIGEKTAACCANLKAILEAGGSSLDNVVRVGVCLIDCLRSSLRITGVLDYDGRLQGDE